MIMSDPTKPPPVTGFRRALYEIAVGASTQRARDEMTDAMVGHACRAVVARLMLELASTKGLSDA